MKRTVLLLSVLLVLVFCLSSCVELDTGVSLNEDGTGSVSVSIGIEKSVYDRLTASSKSDLFKGKTPAPVQTGGTTYMTFSETKEYGTYEEIQDALLELVYQIDWKGETENSTVVDDPSAYTLYQPTAEKKEIPVFESVIIEKAVGIFYSVYTFRATVNAPNYGYSLYDTTDAFKLTITVHMPDKVTQSMGGAVDGDTVTFELNNPIVKTEIAAVTEVNRYGVILGIFGGLVLLVVAGFIIIRKTQ